MANALEKVAFWKPDKKPAKGKTGLKAPPKIAKPKPAPVPAAPGPGDPSYKGPLEADTGIGGSAATPTVPTFPNLPTPVEDAENAELTKLGNEQNALTQEQFGVQTGRVQEDLARQLAKINAQRADILAGVQRGTERLGEQSVKSQKSARESAGARGVGIGGLFDRQVKDIADQYTQQIDDVRRNGDEAQATLLEAQRDAEIGAQRNLDDIARQKKEYEIKVRAGEITNAAEARRKMKEFTESQAKGWTVARANQLMGQGKDEAQARSIAIADARRFYSNVDPTYIDGAFGKLEKPAPSPGEQSYGVKINADRAKQISTKTQARMKKDPRYAVAAQQLDEFKRLSGGQPTAEGFLRFYRDWLASEAGPAGDLIDDPRQQEAKIRSLMREVGGYLSVLFLEEGVR